MQKQFVSKKQGIAMMAMYILGTSVIVPPGIAARQDIWLAYLLALAFSVVLVLIYSRILNHFPEKVLYETLETLMGRPASLVLLILITIFLFQHYAYVLSHFGGIINVAGLPDAPNILPLICLGGLTALGVYLGIKVLGEWSGYFLVLVAAFLIFIILMLSKHMDIDQLRPTLENGPIPLLKEMWILISLPFAETMAFLFVLPPLVEKGAARIGIEAGRNFWIAMICGLTVSLLLVLVYAWFLRYYPGKDLFETMVMLLGRLVSTAFLALLAIFLFQHYAYVVWQFGGFFTVVGLPEFPHDRAHDISRSIKYYGGALWD